MIGLCQYHGHAVCNRSKIQTLERFEVTNKNDVQRLIQAQTKVKWLDVYLSDISWLADLNMPVLKCLSLKSCHTLKALHCLKAPLLKSLHIYEMDFRKEQNWGYFSFPNLEHLGEQLNLLILRTLGLQDDYLKGVSFLKYVNFSKMKHLEINSRQVKDVSILKNSELPVLEAIDLFCPLGPLPHWGCQLKAPELCEFILNKKYIICRPGKGI